MIDRFTIFTKGGIVLWQSSPTPSASTSTTLNSFISDILISQRTGIVDIYKKNNHTVKWTTYNDLGLVFAAVYQSILQLSYMEDFLSSIGKLFVSLYKPQLESLSTFDSNIPRFDGFSDYYLLRLSQVQNEPVHVVVEEKQQQPPPPPAPETKKSSSKRAGKRAAANRFKDMSGGSGTDDSTKSITTTAGKTKRRRKWGVDGMPDEELASDVVLDYSQPSNDDDLATAPQQQQQQDTAGWASQRTKDGDVMVKDLYDEMETILSQNDKSNINNGGNTESSSSKSAFSFFKGITGGSTITKENLEPALAKMKQHLMNKNIAPQVAEYLCESVSKNLIGTKTANWTSIQTTLKNSMESALRKILTPKTSLDLLHEVQKSNTRPYVISVVGVNGVGKSTNLSKIAFWLLQNNLNILIAACDTFRSGAVEQLRVHARNLSQLSTGGRIELYERGYGKDAANIAKDAIEYGKKNHFNVVLIDTAGRRHNDERLMSSLEKFEKLAKPDKIIMVGEALVGTDSVEQAKNFNNAFGHSRNLDFFLISKCDTVGNMIGTIVNMTFSTSIPVLFVGVGQMYTDLRTLSVEWAVNVLMN